MGSKDGNENASNGEEEEEVGAALNAQLQDAMEQSDGDGEASTSGSSHGHAGSTSGGRVHDEQDEDDGDDGSSMHGSSDDESEDADEEPTLRYSRIQSSPLSDLFSRGDTCSSLACSDKYLVLGTHNGGVFILARPGQPNAGISTSATATADKGKGKAKQLENVAEEDLEGQNVVKRYRPHQASVMDLVIDEESQFVASASTDGKVVILNIASSDAQLFDLGRPLRCIALEPSYAAKSTRQFVSGGLSGNLTLHEKGWLGPKDVVLHSGEGPIWAVQWRRNYIAWSNDRGIRIYDTHTSTRIAFIPRNDESPRSDLFPPTLLWQSDTRLVTSQADFIKVIDIRDRRQQERERLEKERLKAEAEKEKESGSVKSDKAGSGYNPLAGMGAYVPAIPGVSSVTGGGSATPNLPPIYAEVTNVLQLDCMISGIVPFLSTAPDSPASLPTPAREAQDTYSTTPNFLVLSYTTDDSFSDESTPIERKPSLPPELRIISIDTGEELSSDVLSVQGYEKFGCKDYKIVGHFPSSSSSSGTSITGTVSPSSNGTTTPSSTPREPPRPSSLRHRQPAKTESYFVISPRDLVLVKKRDVADHIAWLCERHRYEDALSVIERKGLSTSVLSNSSRRGEEGKLDVEEIGQKFLQHLVDHGDWEKAARNLGKILQQDQKKWEDWIFSFVQKGHIQTIIPYIPTQEPQLGRMVYEMILAHFLKTDPPTLLQTIKTWPATIYDAPAVINAIRSEYEREASSSKTSPTINIHMECLVELHLMNKQPGKAVPYYLRLRKPGVFDLIKEYSLFTDVQDQALLLVDFDQDMRRRREKGKQNAGVRNEKFDESKHGEAIQLLVDHTHSIPIPRVVSQLRPNRHYLYMYLDTLFTADPTSAFEYSDLLVDLYAEYEYPRLIDFLRASTTYSLEKAYEICKTRDYVPEMVFLLGRMGNNKQALELIIERLGDVQRAIDFAKEQNDHDLWEDLLKYSETRPAFIRGLLENVGPEIDPIRLIRRIKNGLQIPGLKRALIKILQDFNIQISLIEGCKTILNTDCRHLTLELHDGQTNAFVASIDSTSCHKCSKPAFIPPQPSSSTAASATSAEAISIVFLCRHVFHINCALPDMDLPSRPQHFLNPLLADLGGAGGGGAESGLVRADRDRDIAAKILFASQLKARAKTQVRCPACVGGKGRLLA